jgi:putative MATE family efflux protein
LQQRNAIVAERRRRLLQGPIAPALITLAIPIILGNALQSGYQLTDAFWVGRLGASAVAAVAVSFPVTFLVIALGAGLAMAGATLIAQYMGAGRQDMVNHVAAQTMAMVAITSVVLGTLGYIVTPYLLELLSVAPDVYAGALGFMRVSFVGIIFVFLYAMFQALMRGIGETRLPLFIVIGTVVLNFVLDPLFIFGWGPVPGQGVMGAAIATLVTQALAALIGMIILLAGRHGIELSWRGLVPDPPYIKRAFLLGFPGSVELSTRGLGLVVMSFLVASFGTLTMAAYGVGSTILQVVMIPAMGLSMAVSTLVGQNIGAGNIQRGLCHSDACWPVGIRFRACARRLLRAQRCRRDCRGRALRPHHVPRLGRHGHPALRRGGLPRLWQHADGHGHRAGLAIHDPVPLGLCIVQAHRPARRRAAVVVPRHQPSGGLGFTRLVRARLVEDHAAD